MLLMPIQLESRACRMSAKPLPGLVIYAQDPRPISPNFEQRNVLPLVKRFVEIEAAQRVFVLVDRVGVAYLLSPRHTPSQIQAQQTGPLAANDLDNDDTAGQKGGQLYLDVDGEAVAVALAEKRPVIRSLDEHISRDSRYCRISCASTFVTACSSDTLRHGTTVTCLRGTDHGIK